MTKKQQRQAQAIDLALVKLKDRLGRLGLYETRQAMDVPVHVLNKELNK